MLGLSLPLWVGDDFPRVPFVSGLSHWSVAYDGAVTVILLVSVVGTALAARWRPWFAVSLGALGWLVLHDQHRFQTWIYQYAVTGICLAALPGESGLRFARYWFVALYAHSALSKLDLSFCDELGPVFLKTALGWFGLDPWSWPAAARTLAVLAMPVGELLLAAALAWPGTRRIGRFGAVVLHSLLIGILGPFGLGHSTIVLIWNAAMAAEVWIAFVAFRVEDEPIPRTQPLASLVRIVFWAGVLLPLGERGGWFDAWPSHALYASHVERVNVFVHESEREAWPAPLRRHVLTVDESPWRLVDLTGWSREVRGTPVYPQNRAGLGLAEALAARYGTRLVRVVVLGAADRWTGRRRRAEATGWKAIQVLGDNYFLNAHPSLSRAVAEPPHG